MIESLRDTRLTQDNDLMTTTCTTSELSVTGTRLDNPLVVNITASLNDSYSHNRWFWTLACLAVYSATLNEFSAANCYGFYPAMHYSASAVLRLHVVRLCVCVSVCLSVYPPDCYITLVDSDHTGWNTSKIISRLITVRLMLGLTPTWAIWSNGNTPKIGWNRGGVRNTKKPAISLKRCKIGPRLGYYDGLIGSHTRAFDWYQNQ